MADQRETVFARIREALRKPAPHRHHGHVDYDSAGEPETPPPASGTFRAWLPTVGPTVEEQIALFAQNAATLKADFRVVDSFDEAARELKTMATTLGWKKFATHRDPLAAQLAQRLALPLVTTDNGYLKSELETCDAGITGCDALVAQTGSVLVTSASTGGRALSVLPPHHIVIAQRNQLVSDLTAALQNVRGRYAPNWPSMISFITGPSRTGDIERILVLGAHGPKKLTIFLVP